MSTRPHILIGTPAYESKVITDYAASLAQLHLQVDARFSVEFPSVAILQFARNILASQVLNDPGLTHLLFIDADMAFRPELVARMLAFDKPFVGALYPRRGIRAGRVAEIARQRPDITDGGQLRCLSLDFVGDLAEPPAGDFARAHRVGTGILLLKREVLERMRSAYPELWAESSIMYAGVGHRGGVFQCFNLLQGSDGVFMGEDHSFCHRWSAGCGGEIWACVDTGPVVHAGHSKYVGDYAANVRAGLI
jgi:hypothetical protein